MKIISAVFGPIARATRSVKFFRWFITIAVAILVVLIVGLIAWADHVNHQLAQTAAVARVRGQALGTANAHLQQKGLPTVAPTSAAPTLGNSATGPTTATAPVRGAQGIPGLPGSDGRGVASTTINSHGDLIVTFTDGSTDDAGYVVGARGATGAKGVGITSSQIVDGSLVLTMTTGKSSVVGPVVGPQGATGATGAPGAVGATGAPGADGKDGVNGVSVTSVTIDASNHLIVTYSDGTTGDAGLVPAGPAGPKGDTGAQGVGIKTMACDASSGNWSITLTDGTVLTVSGPCAAQTTTVTATTTVTQPGNGNGNGHH